MANNAQYLLTKIKINGVLQDIITKSTGKYVTVSYGGADIPLADALTDIVADIAALPTGTVVDEKIKTEISKLIDGAPETYNTLKEIAKYIEDHTEAYDLLVAAVGNKADQTTVDGIKTALDTLTETVNGMKTKLDALPAITDDDVANWNNKVDKVTGKGLSTEDFTTELKTKLETTESVSADEKAAWNAKAETTVATAEANGLMSKEDKTRLDGMGAVFVGGTEPAGMKDGDIWIQTIEETPVTPTDPETPVTP